MYNWLLEFFLSQGIGPVKAHSMAGEIVDQFIIRLFNRIKE